MIQIQTDAAFRQSTKESAAGIVFVKNKEQIPLKSSLKHCESNHEAEFQALIWGLKQVQAELNDNEIIQIQSDSEILVTSLQKQYAKHYQKEVDEILGLLPNLDMVFFIWIPDNKNKGPHQLAWQVLNQD
ncbi:ribonuclease HI family protein [Fructobacillus durionis]|uniref:Ribonuclease HI n=1 Tax=Fructobacillus durionis TaxID=283737 RepID=A0A1I1E7Z3_9LACO|nr:ribonuclease HI family protein [Fructobacillus durionis]SFB83251.1 ribonuclease HI [Fructobacillus durionis]